MKQRCGGSEIAARLARVERVVFKLGSAWVGIGDLTALTPDELARFTR